MALHVGSLENNRGQTTFSDCMPAEGLSAMDLTVAAMRCSWPSSE